MKIEKRVILYTELFTACKAFKPVFEIVDKGYTEHAGYIQRLELIRELGTMLTKAYKVNIPVIVCGVRDANYVRETKEIYLGEPDLEDFLHQFRHHLQNEAKDPKKKYILVENSTKIDPQLPFKDTIYTMPGEDDALSWVKMIMNKCNFKS